MNQNEDEARSQVDGSKGRMPSERPMGAPRDASASRHTKQKRDRTWRQKLQEIS